jgi:hypothetical protein
MRCCTPNARTAARSRCTSDGADGPTSSSYLTPAQAYLYAERIRTAAWIAEQLSKPEDDD